LTTKRCFLLILFAIFAGLAACSGSPTSSNSGTQRVSLGSERVRYTFDDDAQGWDTFTAPGAEALFRFGDHVLEGAVVSSRGYVWSLNAARYNDLAIDAEVRQTRGVPGNGFGLMCRADADGNGYYFVISSAGQFAILKGHDRASNPEQLVKWQGSDALLTNEAPNQIQAICAQNYLSFYANGRFLAQTRDSEFNVGQIGVVLGAGEKAAWVSFDSIIIRDAALNG
jgi:hypothetical protein